MPNPIIDIKNLEVRDSDRRLSQASFSVSSGETLAIYGPGGSGKSLLLRFIYGNVPENLAVSYKSCYIHKGLEFYLDLNNGRSGQSANIPPNTYDFYMIDEPENGYSIKDFVRFWEETKSSGKTIVFVTHSLSFLEKFADRVLVLKYGDQVGMYAKDSFFNNEDPYINYISKMGC